MENKKLIDIERDFTEEEEMLFKPGIVTPKEELPDTMEEIVIRQYKLGMTLKQITKGQGLSYGKIYEILHRHNVPLKHGRYNHSGSGDRMLTMSQLEKESLVTDYLAGMELKDLYEKYNINKHGCYSILDAAGVARRQKRHTVALDLDKIIRATTVADSEVEPVEFFDEGETITVIINKNAVRPVGKIDFTIYLSEGEGK